MASLDRLHVEVEFALLLQHGGVLGVCQRAGLPSAEPCQVVLVPAEGLGHCSTDLGSAKRIRVVLT